MKFEQLTLADLDELKTIQPEGWSDITLDCRFYIESDYCFPVKATLDGQIVGIGASIYYMNSAWMAHIIVGEEHRKKGIGFCIVQELLKGSSSRRIKSYSLIATELGKFVYLKAGFKVLSDYIFMERQKDWIPQILSKNIVPYESKYHLAVIELDKKISGENREQLIDGFLTNGQVYIKNRKVDGFYLPDLKEGPIYADSEEAGIELMIFKYSTVNKAVLPEENLLAIDFLEKNGFIRTNTKGTRMIMGEDINWIPEKMFSRIGGNLG